MRILGLILVLIIIFFSLIERLNIRQEKIKWSLAVLWGVAVFIVMRVSPCNVYSGECLKISSSVNLIGSSGSALLMYFCLAILDLFDDEIIKYIIFCCIELFSYTLFYSFFLSLFFLVSSKEFILTPSEKNHFPQSLMI